MGTLVCVTVALSKGIGFLVRLGCDTGCETTALGCVVGNSQADKLGTMWWTGTVSCEVGCCEGSGGADWEATLAGCWRFGCVVNDGVLALTMTVGFGDVIGIVLVFCGLSSSAVATL